MTELASDHSPALQRVGALIALIAAGGAIVIGLAGLLDAPVALGVSFVAAALLMLGIVVFLTRATPVRWAGAVLFVGAVAAWVWALIHGEALAYVVGMIIAVFVSMLATLWVLRPRAYHPPARRVAPPRHAFLLMNPKSGGGKVQQFHLVARATEMGADVKLLEPDVDVIATLEAAVRDGADLLGAAGGDGTQALVAGVAAAHDLPMLCIPAGTRNHFAMDVGLDRRDPSRTLRALGDEGEEIVVDLGDVGGHPFVNNVSLGAYAEIVARPDYRDAKLATTLKVLPEVSAPDARSGLTIIGPDGERITDPQMVQVANNPYARPEDAAPVTSRPRLDNGLLGVQVVAYRSSKQLGEVAAAVGTGAPERAEAFVSWTATSVTVTAAGDAVDIQAGVDGEHMELGSPLEISIRPGALRLRVPRERPGPKTGWPQLNGRSVRRLWAIVSGD